MKKLIAVLLALCLAVGMLPMFALADGIVLIQPTDGNGNKNPLDYVEVIKPGDKDDEDEGTQSGPGVLYTYHNGTTTEQLAISVIMEQKKPEARVGDTYYAKVADAINAAKSGQTVELLRSATLSANAMLVDGATLSIDKGDVLTVPADTTFTKNGNVEGTVKYLNDTSTTPGGDEEEDDEPVVIPDEFVAKNLSNDTQYKNLADALVDAVFGDTVCLLDDLTLDNSFGDFEVHDGVTLVIPSGVTLTIPSDVTFTNYGKIVENGKIEGNVVDKTEPAVPEQPDDEDDNVKNLYRVEIKAPDGAGIVVWDADGDKCANFRGNVWSLANGEYTYAVYWRGHTFWGSFEVNNAPLVVTGDWAQTAWRVTVKPVSHGDVWVRDYEAAEGDVVKVYIDPDNGYYLKDLSVTDYNGRHVDVWRVEKGVYAFEMPYLPVYIEADFERYEPAEYRVYVVESTPHGDIEVDKNYAEEGEWVYITVDPDAGYRLDELTVTRPSGNTVKVEHVRGNVYRFKMPGVRVTVDAEFVATSNPFDDVKVTDWFYKAVNYVYWNDLMDGVSARTFAPNTATSRAMVVTIIYRMAGSPKVTGSSAFNDVAADKWYSDAVTWAADRGIVEGRSSTVFDPNSAVTREELVTMLHRYAEFKGYNTSAGENTNILSYLDFDELSEYAIEPMQWACGEGIIDGVSDGELSPKTGATRAQLAAMLMRFCVEYVD